jgi:homoserine acetyltransferase
LLQKERMALMPDENFEGDFLEMQENNHGITNAASAVGSLLIRSQERYENDFRNGSKCIINVCNCNNSVKFVCVYNKHFQKSFN